MLKELDIAKKKPKITAEQKPIIIQMAREGKTPTEIAQALGLNRPNTISTFLHRQKWLIKDQKTL